MTELRRQTYLPVPPAPGAGWKLECPGCERVVITRAGGRCPGCTAVLLEGFDAAADPDTKVLPALLSKPVFLPAMTLFAFSPSLLLTYGMTGSLIAAVILAPFFFLATYFVSVPMLLFARSLYRKVHPPEKNGVRMLSGRVEVERVWFDITRLRQRRGLVLSLTIRAIHLHGRRIEIIARLRGPDGRYLRGDLRNYRGDLGEVRTKFVTAPLKNTVARFEKIWMFCPLRALGLPPGTDEVDLSAEFVIGVDGKVEAEVDLPIRFRPLPEDFPHLLPGATAPVAGGVTADDPADPTGVTFVSADAPAEAGHASRACPICGDLLATDLVVRCSLCDSPHHHECWEYNEGCSTYACEGRPER